MLNTQSSNSKPSIRIKELIVAAALAALVTAWFGKPAQAFDHCHNYASTAVQQQGKNLTQGCGYSGWRWHGWKKGHYDWCKGVSLKRSNRETERRAIKLAQCRFN